MMYCMYIMCTQYCTAKYSNEDSLVFVSAAGGAAMALRRNYSLHVWARDVACPSVWEL